MLQGRISIIFPYFLVFLMLVFFVVPFHFVYSLFFSCIYFIFFGRA